MDENFRKQLEENGADVEGTLKRFMGNEALYMKFIMKFLDDKNFEGIKSNLEKNDFEGAYVSAHTLKGVTANLGLNPVYGVATQISDMLKGKAPGEIDREKLEALKDQLAAEHSRFVQLLEKYRP
ncbi:MAG: Hpt domain-containing protein [Lachnospiraceae bacterium]|jgi:FOG: HPt domain|nr:Hpt domain-containing protein [Lachnospiraceae bacterium]